MFNRIRMMMAVALAQALGGKTPLSLQRMASDHNRTVNALRDTIVSREPFEPVRRRYRGGAGRVTPARYRGSSSFRGRNGAQECARRVRQIERGQLTASNGLIGTYMGGTLLWAANSHGDLYPHIPR